MLQRESVRAIRFGSFYSLFVILGGACTIGILDLLSGVSLRSIVPLQLFLLAALCITTSLWLLARRAREPDLLLRLGVMLLAVLPSGFLILLYFLDAGMAAAFYTGPVSWIHFPPLVLTGLFFSLRFSALAGLLAAAMQLGLYALVQTELLRTGAENTELLRNLSDTGPNLMRGILLLSTGIVIGLVARYSRRLVHQIAEEQGERNRINGLFGQFVSGEIRNRIIAEKSNLQAEKVRGVILFSDIRGFTGLSESISPEQLVHQLNRYFSVMVPVIEKQGGVVDKFIGDAIMVTFGTVLKDSDPCGRALQCARDMISALNSLNTSFEREGLETLEIGIGIHESEVVQGIVGSETRSQFTVLGDGVNVAARLESATRALKVQILLSLEFAARLQCENHQVQLYPLGRVKLKGRREPVSVFTVPDVERRPIPTPA